MATVDPFAGYGEPEAAPVVMAGSLEGMNLEPSAPDERSWLTSPDPSLDMNADPLVGPEVLSPEDAAALVQDGALGGDDLDAQMDAALEADSGLDPTTPPPGEASAEAAPAELPSPHPDDVADTRKAIKEVLTDGPPPPKRGRGRPRTVTPEEVPEPLVGDEWIVFKQGDLDTGAPFWFQVGTAKGKTREKALRDWFRQRPEGESSVSAFIVKANGWRLFTVSELIEQRPIKRTVIS